MEDKVKVISKMAHDLRNPLGVVLAYSQLLERAMTEAEATDPRMLRQIQGILRAAHRMDELIEGYSVAAKQAQETAALAEANEAQAISSTA